MAAAVINAEKRTRHDREHVATAEATANGTSTVEYWLMVFWCSRIPPAVTVTVIHTTGLGVVACCVPPLTPLTSVTGPGGQGPVGDSLPVRG